MHEHATWGAPGAAQEPPAAAPRHPPLTSRALDAACTPLAKKAVLVAVCDRIDDRPGRAGVAWCSVADIAGRLGLSERRVQAYLRALVDEGFLEVDHYRRNRRGRPSAAWRVPPGTREHGFPQRVPVRLKDRRAPDA